MDKFIDIITDVFSDGQIMIFHVFQDRNGVVYYRYLEKGKLANLKVPTRQVIKEGKVDYDVF